MFQEKDEYFSRLKSELENYFRDRPGVQVFVFGSALRREKFNDIDVAISGEVEDNDNIRLKAIFEASTFPYSVDIININRVSEKFKQNIFKYPIIWIKR